MHKDLFMFDSTSTVWDFSKLHECAPIASWQHAGRLTARTRWKLLRNWSKCLNEPESHYLTPILHFWSWTALLLLILPGRFANLEIMCCVQRSISKVVSKEGVLWDSDRNVAWVQPCHGYENFVRNTGSCLLPRQDVGPSRSALCIPRFQTRVLLGDTKAWT